MSFGCEGRDDDSDSVSVFVYNGAVGDEQEECVWLDLLIHMMDRCGYR